MPIAVGIAPERTVTLHLSTRWVMLIASPHPSLELSSRSHRLCPAMASMSRANAASPKYTATSTILPGCIDTARARSCTVDIVVEPGTDGRPLFSAFP